MAVTAEKTTETASEGLSQLLAKILNQLSLSAWLPAAALTLVTTVILGMGAAVTDDKRAIAEAVAKHKRDASVVVPKPLGPSETLNHSFRALSQLSLGGIFLLVASVVVLTMLTQAFAFESIRVLEGYWGTNKAVERLAQARVGRFAKRRASLVKTEADLRTQAWEATAAELARREQRRLKEGRPVIFTPEMIAKLGAPVIRKTYNVALTDAQRDRVARTDWRSFATPDLLRRRINVQKSLDDYPLLERRVQPTRLGNILRRFEDQTGYVSVEALVDEVFDRLPFSLRVSHDEQRSRLDLYCSMVFVWLAIAAIAVARFAFSPDTRPYAVVGVGTVLILEAFTYRAALASARYYGSLLVQISKYRDDDAAPLETNPEAPPATS